MLRLALAAFAAATLPSVSTAQTQPASTPPAKIPAPVKYAGTYHVSTATWTRSAGSVASFGLIDNIYSNTASTGYYDPAMGPTGGGAFGATIDDGAIPGTTNPTVFTFGGAVTDIYNVTEIQVGYCDFEAAAAMSGWTLDFYEDYAPCTLPSTTPVGTVVLSGFPTNGCWVADIDLTASSGTGETFSIQADGGAAAPGFDGDPALDSFGIRWQYTGAGTANAGPLIAGDPASTEIGWISGIPNTGSNTYFGDVGGCPGSGTGFGNDDFFWREDTYGTGGLYPPSACYFFGGYINSGNGCGGGMPLPMGGFWMEMSGQTTVIVDCICTPGCVGAVTSTGAPALCEVYGNLDASANDAELRATGVPANQFGLFATGLAQVSPMTVNSGNGWICIDPGAMGGLGRFQGANQIKNSGPTGTFSLDTTAGEWSLASVPTSTGTYAVIAGTTNHFQAWFRDPVGAGWNFSSSTIVTWQ